MRRSLWPLLCCVLLLTAPTFKAEPSKPASPIRLKALTFVPGEGEPRIAQSLAIAEYPTGRTGYYLIQFQGPIQGAWKEEAAALGIELLEYVPDFAFKVRMEPNRVHLARNMESVKWVGVFHPAYKLSPDLLRGGTKNYTVRLEAGADVYQALENLRSVGVTVLNSNGSFITVAAKAEHLDALAHISEVAWIENLLQRETFNKFGGGLSGALDANAAGYDGSSQTVAVADTGLGDGTLTGAHPEIEPSRIQAIHDWPGVSSFFCYDVYQDGPVDVDTGHGTHTSGSAVASGDATGEGRGTAPAASLIFQAVEDYAEMYGLCLDTPSGYYLVGLPADLRNLYSQAYFEGARIHSNSWGSNAQGDYTTDSQNTDDFVWNNPDISITFSAGNFGADNNANGIVDTQSVGSPATAKNVIAVGASENDRQGDYPCDPDLSYTNCSVLGGQNLIPAYGDSWPEQFPAPPLSFDSMVGDPEQMAGFSSRGPTSDGRIKPDVVAPGTWILSLYSDLYQQQYDLDINPQTGGWQYDGWGDPASELHKYMGGTSMSNALLAGGAAVVRDYYEKARGHSASAALVKATFINSAEDLLDENNDGVYDNAFPIPNNHEGWGRINLSAATDGTRQFEDNAAGLSTGQNTIYHYLALPGVPFKATLVWSDYPSSTTASRNLVNDLDLLVRAPDGTPYQGNVFVQGWSESGGAPDRLNNVENVFLSTPTVGIWEVEVIGYNIPYGPQPFALAVNAGPSDLPYVSIVTPVNGSTVSGLETVQVTASDPEDPVGSLNVELSFDAGPWQATTYNGVTGYYELEWDTTTISDGVHQIDARSANSSAEVGNAPTVTVDVNNHSPTVTIVGPTSSTVVSDSVTIEIEALDPEDPLGTLVVEVGVDGAGWQTAPYNSQTGFYEYNWDTTTVSNGLHALDARATDSSSATRSASPVAVNVQNTVPDVVIFSPTEGSTVSGTISVEIAATDVVDPLGSLNVEVAIDGAAWQAAPYNNLSGHYEWAWDTATAVDGSRSVAARATNSSDKTGYSDPVTVNADNSAPTISIVSPTEGSTVSGDVLIEIEASDENTPDGTLTVRVWIDNGPFSEAFFNPTSGNYEYTWDSTSALEGIRTINANTTDPSNRTTAADPVSVGVDNQPPTALIFNPIAGANVSGTVTVRVNATDPSDPRGSLNVEVAIEGAPWQTATFDSISGNYEWPWDTTATGDGSRRIDARVTNSGGRTTNAAPVTVQADNERPDILIVSPTESSTVSGDVLIQIDASDENNAAGTLTVRIWIDTAAPDLAVFNSSTGYYEHTWNSASALDGNHTINAHAVDSAGRVGYATPVSVQLSSQGPTVQIVNPANASTVTGLVTVQVDASDSIDPQGSLDVEISVDSAGWQVTTFNPSSGYYEWDWDTTTEGSGNHFIDARATNSGGMTENANLITVTVESSTPSATIVSPAAGSTLEDTVTVQVSVSDAGDPPGSLNVEVAIDGVNWLPASFNSGNGYYAWAWDTATTVDGAHSIDARATNSGSITGYADPVTVTVNNDAPTATIVNPLPDDTVSGDVLVQVDASDTLDPAETLTVRVWIDNGPFSAASYNPTSGYYEYTWDSTTALEGIHTVNAHAVDSSSRTGNADPVSVGVDNQPPTALIFNPIAGTNVSGTVTVRVNATDPSDPRGSLNVEVAIEGAPWQTATFDSISGNYEWPWDTTATGDGSRRIDARVTNSGGRTTMAAPVTVQADNERPDILIVSPTESSTVSGDVLIQIDASDENNAAGTLTVRIWIDTSAPDLAVYNSTTGYYEHTWNSASALDGNHTINAHAVDSAGRVGYATPVSVQLSSQGPTVQIVNPANASTVTGLVTVQVDASDSIDPQGSLDVEISVDSAGWQVTTFNPSSGYYEWDWDTTTEGSGNHFIDARATNSGGMTENANLITVTVESSTPSATIVSPAAGSTLEDTVTVQVSVSDAGDPPGSLNVEVAIDGVNWLPASFNSGNGYYAWAWDTATTVDGAHSIDARATNSGSITGYADPVTVTVNNDAPTATIVNPLPDDTVSGDVLVQVDASDTLDPAETLTVRVWIDNGPFSAASYNPTSGYYEYTWDSTTALEGIHTVNAHAVDSSSRTGNADPVSVGVDNQPPTALIFNPIAGTNVSGTVTVRVNATDPSDPRGSLNVEVAIEGAPWQTATFDSISGNYEWPWDTTATGDGSRRIDARVTNSGGRTTMAAPVTVQADNERPDILIVSPTESSTVSGDVLIQIDASDENNAAGTLTVRIWIDTSAPDLAVYNSTTGYYEHTWNSASALDGNHTINAHAVDSAGRVGYATPVSVQLSNTAPVVNIHVADLDGSSLSSRKTWTASVVVTVTDSNGLPVQGADVSGTWNLSEESQASCTTDSGGLCSVQSGSLAKKVKTAEFAVVDLRHDSSPYEPAENIDPDGDSDGTRIVVRRE